MTYNYKFPMAGNTATVVVFNYETNEVLLGKRRDDSDAYPGRWCLPGGYLNVGTERLATVARRETKEEAGIDIREEQWNLFYVDDKPGTDPRYLQVINLCYTAGVTDDQYNAVEAGDDLAEVKWTKLPDALNINLAFAHNEILKEFETRKRKNYPNYLA